MKTIIVTGGNRGIGLEICKQLDAFGHRVIMGSRNAIQGHDAVKGLDTNIIVKQLDVTDKQSISSLRNFVEKEFGKLDVLINNAGLGSTHFDKLGGFRRSGSYAFLKEIPLVNKAIEVIKPALKKSGVINTGNTASQIPRHEVELIMDTNLYGPWMMVQQFSFLLQKSNEGRVINMSSGMGELKSLKADYPGYRISKASLNALSIMLADEFDSKGVGVYAMCPGWVRTDMGGPDAPRSVAEGADTAIWLATAEGIESGKFYRDRKVIDW